MARYASLTDLERIGTRALNEDLQVLAKARRASIDTATFLSHSSKDDEKYIAGAISILEKHGTNVYLDKKDPFLPPYTNRETAAALRNRIRKCKKFVLFATEKSSGSKWMPWELGVSDGYKGPSCVAIFPGIENATNVEWAEQEYLGIYDRIMFGKLGDDQRNVWMVVNQEKNTAVELRRWLKQ